MGQVSRPNCRGCGVLKTDENTYRNTNNGRLRARCKRCMADEEQERNGDRRDALAALKFFGY